MSYLGRRRKSQQRKAKNALKRPLRAPSMMFDPPMCEHGEQRYKVGDEVSINGKLYVVESCRTKSTGVYYGERPKIEWRDDAKDRKDWLTRLRDWLGL